MMIQRFAGLFLAGFLFSAAALDVAAAECKALLPVPKAGAKVLTAFDSDRQLRDWLKCVKENQAARMRNEQTKMKAMGSAQALSAAPLPAPATAAQPAAVAKAAGPGKAESDSVTNTQTAGVDEGDIVKVHGKHLVILRRGRLFTVDVSGSEPRPVGMVDAYAPGANPGGAWYDEMLISGNTIVVIGYSYARGGTEVGLFDLDANGGLRHRATYNLRSNDYYSARNYASRLIGTKLIFYTPLYLNMWQPDPYAGFPAMRRWTPNAAPADFRPIAPATRIYRTDDTPEPDEGLAFHTVTVCDIAQPEMRCEATAVMGPPGRVFYVSAQSVYVWTTAYRRSGNQNQVRSAVFRLPLDGSAPSALKTTGAPIDQFSFLESADGYLNVLLQAEGQGDAMWASERGKGDFALLRAPLASFGNGSQSAPASQYKLLPGPKGYALHNRFVGAYLLYGAGTGWAGQGADVQQTLYAVHWGNADPAQALEVGHAIDRIEALGNNALAVGSRGPDLVFTPVALKDTARLAPNWVRPNAAQGETRSHGFFYKPDSEDDGLLGLPVARAARPGWKQLAEGSAAVQFLRNHKLQLSDVGELAASELTATNDQCKASCVDWYGNARPLFLRGRIYALMGYELVEGRLEGKRIRETHRVSFAPRAGWGRGQ